MEESNITLNDLICVAIGGAIAIGVVAGLFSSLGLLDTQFILVVPLALGVALVVLILTYTLIMSTRKQYFEYASPLEGESYDPGNERSRAYYRIPLYCPHCKDRVDLQRIHWIEAQTFVCQNCMGKVRAESSEEGSGR